MKITQGIKDTKAEAQEQAKQTRKAKLKGKISLTKAEADELLLAMAKEMGYI